MRGARRLRDVSDIGADHVFDFVGIPSVYEQDLAMLAGCREWSVLVAAAKASCVRRPSSAT